MVRWIASRRVGGSTTSFAYSSYGAIQIVAHPDSVTTTYEYQAAHRIVKITDIQRNCAQYTLDVSRNKTAEQVYGANGTLHKNLSCTLNTHTQLTKAIDALGRTVFDTSGSGSYEASSNLVQSADSLGIRRQLSYDALNRLVQTFDNYNGTNKREWSIHHAGSSSVNAMH